MSSKQTSLLAATNLAAWLKTNKKTLAVAESCTGGLVSSLLTDVPGSSTYTFLNVVTYSNTAKQQLLNVPAELLETHGAVSPEVAKAMAKGIVRLSGCHYGLSLTGIAGPEGGSLSKPVGLVYVGFCQQGSAPEALEVVVGDPLSRERMKHAFAEAALTFCLQQLRHL